MNTLLILIIGASSLVGVCSFLYLCLAVIHETYRELLQHIVIISNSNYLAGKSYQQQRKLLSCWALRISQRAVGSLAGFGAAITISALINLFFRG